MGCSKKTLFLFDVCFSFVGTIFLFAVPEKKVLKKRFSVFGIGRNVVRTRFGVRRGRNKTIVYVLRLW